jgi:uncharacterized tellurite resistance protein B-like protein
MKKYTDNSPEAMARVLVMQMMANDNTTPEELDRLELLDVYKILGIERKRFIQVLDEYCNDLSDEADEDGKIPLIVKERINGILDCITERKKQLLLAALLLDVFKVEREFSEIEMVVFRHLLTHWYLTLDDLREVFA